MRVFLVVLVLGLVAAGVGVLVLGAYPPAPHPTPVEHVLPNSSFRAHA